MKTSTVVALLFTFLTVTSVISMLLLLQIDNIVKNMDSYGLQYDNSWLNSYSMLTIPMFGLILFDLALAIYILFFHEPQKLQALQPAI